MADKGYSVGFDVKNVQSANMSRYADGYNYASVACKMADNEYMHVSYEWKGKQIPEFAMTAMEIMKSLGSEKASVDLETVEAYERASVAFAELAKKMKEKMPKEDEEEMDDEEKKGKKTKK